MQEQGDGALMCYSCPVGVQALGSPRGFRSVSAITCAPPGATQCELQSNLQMAAINGVEGSQARQNCDPKLATASAGLGAT